MILPTGNRANAEPGETGFTLVEMILVMALLMIVLGVAFPSLKNFFRGRNLDSEARRFLALTRYGASRAVSEGVPMVLWINAGQRSYGLQAQPGYLEADPNAKTFSLAQDIQVEVELPAVVGPMHSNLWTQANQPAGHLPMIRLLPDGFISETSPQRVLFRQGGEETISVAENFNRRTYEIEVPLAR